MCQSQSSMERIAVVVSCLLACGAASAAPTVTAVSGEVRSGAQLTIAGAGFGEKTPAKPLIWADFEQSLSPTPSGQLSAWHLAGCHDSEGFTLTTVDKALGSTRAARWDVSRHTLPRCIGVGVKQDSTRFFVFAKRKYAYSSAHPYNWKVYRFWQSEANGNANVFSAQGGIAITETNSIAPNVSYWHNEAPQQVWITEEVLFDQGDLNTKSGVFELHQNGRLFVGGVGQRFVLRNSDSPGPYRDFYLQNQVANETASWSVGSYVYYDDIYMDNTWSRVALGNAPTWAQSTVREIQLPLEWTGSRVVIALRQGGLTSLSGAYLYVFDSSGSVNPEGFPITGGTAPRQPDAVTVR